LILEGNRNAAVLLEECVEADVAALGIRDKCL
jgi:hypothetical protein